MERLEIKNSLSKHVNLINELIDSPSNDKFYRISLPDENGLTVDISYGKMLNDHVLVNINAVSLTLTDNKTYHICIDTNDFIIKAVEVTAKISGQIPIYAVTTSSGVIAEIEDLRGLIRI